MDAGGGERRTAWVVAPTLWGEVVYDLRKQCQYCPCIAGVLTFPLSLFLLPLRFQVPSSHKLHANLFLFRKSLSFEAALLNLPIPDRLLHTCTAFPQHGVPRLLTASQGKQRRIACVQVRNSSRKLCSPVLQSIASGYAR